MPFRVLNYLVQIWADFIKQTGEHKLPLIYPLVFYHGNTPYNGYRNISELIEAPLELIDKILFKNLHIVDMHDITDETLREHNWAGILEFVCKHIFKRDIAPYLPQLINMCKALQDEKDTGNYITLLVKYILMVANNMQEPIKFVKTLHNELKEPIKGAIMTIADQLREEGMKSGMQQGMQKGERTALECLLQDKFNEIPDRYKEIIEHSNPDDLLKMLRRVLKSNNINDVFDG